ncbi:MAG: hypothetical protein FJX03_03715 [Alphaproteobacteria bacterium]|nr:hypothetical protein [Alphaproteobacteria bacterium]
MKFTLREIILSILVITTIKTTLAHTKINCKDSCTEHLGTHGAVVYSKFLKNRFLKDPSADFTNTTILPKVGQDGARQTKIVGRAVRCLLECSAVATPNFHCKFLGNFNLDKNDPAGANQSQEELARGEKALEYVGTLLDKTAISNDASGQPGKSKLKRMLDPKGFQDQCDKILASKPKEFKQFDRNIIVLNRSFNP